MPKDDRSPEEDEEERPSGSSSDRRRLDSRDVFRLIFRTYRESLPFLIIFLAGLLLATWIVTELVF